MPNNTVIKLLIVTAALTLTLLYPSAAQANYAVGAIAYNHHQYSLAITLFEDAASRGESKAMLMLGLMHDNGLGVTRSSKTAFSWYLRAARAGESRAMFNVYEMQRRGDGTHPDSASALEWLQKSTEQGFAEARFRWATLLYEGREIKKDIQTALMWLEIVSQEHVKGAEQAITLRNHLRE